MKVFQWKRDYFYGTGSGYGTLRTEYGYNIFSDIKSCEKNLGENPRSNIKECVILEYTLDMVENPIIHKLHHSI
jgi:hypothetical protein